MTTLTTFWGSTSAIDHLGLALQRGQEGARALHRLALTEAARHFLRKRIVAADLTTTQASIARVVVADSDCTQQETIEAVGTATGWADEAGADRGTTSGAICRLRTLGSLEILRNGDRHEPWLLRWVFSAEEWQRLQEDAAEITRTLLSEAAQNSRTIADFISKIAI
jgi:hypothetical protein